MKIMDFNPLDNMSSKVTGNILAVNLLLIFYFTFYFITFAKFIRKQRYFLEI